MNLYRTSQSGLVAVQPLDPTETDGLAAALLRGSGGALGADELLFLTTDVGDGTATALAVDAEGDVVVVGAADGEVGNDAVTEALQRASAVADRSTDDLDDHYEGEGSLREAHADYFDREPLAPEAFNDDQRVRLLGVAFDGDALDLATFLSDRDVPVDPVRVDAFGDPESDEYLVRFEAIDRGAEGGGTDAQEGDADAGDAATGDEHSADGADATDSNSDEHWIAGASASENAAKAERTADGGTASQSSDGSDADADADGPVGHQSALTDAADEDELTDEGAESDETGGDSESDEGNEQADSDDSIDLPVLLEAVSEGVKDRLVGTFDEDAADIVSVERGNELVVRPDHPAYAGGVLRYRLRVGGEGEVSFEVNIYGGSEAEKEQMRAVIRENEEPIESELGYQVAERYDGFQGSREFASYDQVAAAEIVDEFDRLVRFFNPRVMRA